MSPSPIEGYLPVIQHFIEFYYFVDKLYASGREHGCQSSEIVRTISAFPNLSQLPIQYTSVMPGNTRIRNLS
jgi:hypothetical protein